MAWVTHNIVAPTSWSVYDQLDRRLPKQIAVYPNPDAALPQPTDFYVMGYPNWVMPAGTLTSVNLNLKDLRDPANLLEIIRYIAETGIVYEGPYSFMVNGDDNYEVNTAGLLMSDNVVAQGPKSNETRTGSTQGYTLAISNWNMT